jgi:hypothetical protein
MATPSITGAGPFWLRWTLLNEISRADRKVRAKSPTLRNRAWGTLKFRGETLATRPARSAPPAPGPAPASSAVRSRPTLDHRQQRSHALGVKSRPDQQPPPIREANLHSRIAGRAWRDRRGCFELHFDEFRRGRPAQPLLPPIEMGHAQAPLPAKRRHRLAAPRLLGHDPSPLRPRLRASLSLRHAATLLYPNPANKMQSAYRSPMNPVE